MQVEQPAPVEVDSSTYLYEDYLADMGNTPSSEAQEGGGAGPMPIETEGGAHIGRLQAITGAKAVDTKVKPRGPKADAADHGFITVRCARLTVPIALMVCP
jgi:hypothetical protein